MTLPAFWRRAVFSVADSADILAVPEDTLRTWLAREPTGDHIGARENGRVFLSGNDLFFFSLVREFSGYGVAVRTAMLKAHGIAEDCYDDLPKSDFIIIRKRSTFDEFELTNDPDIGDRPCVVIPVRQMVALMLDRMRDVFSRGL